MNKSLVLGLIEPKYHLFYIVSYVITLDVKNLYVPLNFLDLPFFFPLSLSLPPSPLPFLPFKYIEYLLWTRHCESKNE